MFDVAQARKRFPALNSGAIFMDNAGGSLILQSVADEIRDYLLTDNVQHGASYRHSQQGAKRLADSTEKFRRMFNARFADEMIFGPSATQLLKNLSIALAPMIQPGDELIVSNTEHEANVGPWAALAEQCGATLRFWKVHRETFRLEIDDLFDLITPKTRLIAFCQVSNILGAINPVRAVTQLARERNILTVVDGVAYAPHGAVDVQALDCDAYVVSLYKVFGPHIGLMYGRRELMQTLRNVNHAHIPTEHAPYRFQPGGICYELAVGAGRLVDYLSGDAETSWSAISQRLQAFAAHENKLTNMLLDYLKQQTRVRIVGPGDTRNRVGTVSFTVKGMTPEQVCLVTDQHDIGIRHGHFHSVQLLRELGVFDQGGVVRVSLAHYNSSEEIQRLLNALDQALTNAQK
ncbi:cysteine desulfurase-like protein [Permianibacter aggregans]|uniref:Cysteine desulfurase family protein (TIGR01976 family) n=1 Tax=Permianibacter aggregans TaxID=1510150 RepID=A0A4R6UWU0_9GAMM|nr:cysteine desulfurase-like protein [Permianibacter aggregans]QGX38590.1 cysteine desulfurase-like protein [Permianibacter aggregans]TDQ50373.1 cysteine desulfurase family protein (TIGR01976 family) [Permianibacter aggregans]